MEKKLSSTVSIKQTETATPATITLLWMDLQSPMIKTIRKHCSLGLMDKINDNGADEIVVRGEKLSETEWLSLNSKPMYVSSFDFN